MSESTTQPETDASAANDTPPPRRKKKVFAFISILVLVAILSAGISGLLVSIFTRKQEAKNPYIRFVDVNEQTTDPAVWGVNWPRQYDLYLKTADPSRTRYGGSEAMPAEKLEKDPWLRRMFSGYAFSLDYRDRRGHAYMLHDQEHTQRVTQRAQPGACLNCHAAIIPTFARVGIENGGDPNDYWGAAMKGFPIVSAMSYSQAHAELLKTPDGSSPSTASMRRDSAPGGSPSTLPATTHPTTQEALAAHAGSAHAVSCVDCHDPKTMELRVTRPGFILGIQSLARSKAPTPHLPSIDRWRQSGSEKPYDPNRDASRQEMRSFVCGQCHVEYYCGLKETLLFPWAQGLKVENIEAFYDSHKFPNGEPFYDFAHGETGAHIYKAQHPEFELWSQGIHARAGVACADCHMPYVRQGAMKVSDHYVRSPLTNIARACQVCHPVSETELLARAEIIQNRNHDLLQRGGTSLVQMLDAIKLAKANGAKEEQLKPALDLHRKAQWRLDFVAAENSMGFHASQETARILAESIDYSRQAQILAQTLLQQPGVKQSNTPTTPPEGVTPANKSPIPENPNYPKGDAGPPP